MPAEKLALRTNKKWGSKFLPEWSVPQICDWIEEQVNAAGWTLTIQEPNPLDIHFTQDVGLVEGKRVRTIQIRSDGRNVHAYPIKD